MFMMADHAWPSKKPRRECSFQTEWQTCGIYPNSNDLCSYWHDIGKIKTLEGKARFGKIAS